MTATTKRRGFSLIEVAVCLLILAILSAATVPAVARLGSRRSTESAATVLRNLVARCRSNALERGEQIDLVIDSASTFFWLRTTTSRVTIDAEAMPPVAHGTINARQGRQTIRCDETGATSNDTLMVGDEGRVEPLVAGSRTSPQR